MYEKPDRMDSTNKLVEGLRAGSYRDFDTLYRMYVGNLYGFVFGLTRSAEQTRSIVQDTFVKVWTGRSRLDASLPFKSYLFQISKHLIIDEFRKRLAEPRFEDYLDYCEHCELSEPAEAEHKLDYDRFVEELERAKQRLTPRQREIFELSKEEGLTSSEIAGRLGISEQTVYNQLSTALRILRSEISPGLGMLFMLFFTP